MKLDAITDYEGLVYAGPGGVLAFNSADGGLMVEHDQQLVPERQQKTGGVLSAGRRLNPRTTHSAPGARPG
ncbi:MAG: hypothetical protein IPF78_17340 [Flavobacteriales bacterium]|nr:hypothetical protein [Flavobacteriales bacterium]